MPLLPLLRRFEFACLVVINQLLTYIQDEKVSAEEDLDMMAGIKSEAVGTQLFTFDFYKYSLVIAV